MTTATAIQRLHWGCGRSAAPGWLNCDRQKHSGIDISCDIREGLPLPTAGMDYAVSMHALQEVPYADLAATLQELRRVLKPDGLLRLGLPDLDKGIEAYLRGDRAHFQVPDEDVRSLGGKFIVHMLWYGHSRLLFTYDFAEEMLLRAGFARVCRCEYRQTESPYPEIVELDNREEESLYVEAFK